MKPKVSIIVPCYGVEKYLDRCVNSLIIQTLKDIEIILVDDKSPDNVPQMCDEWAKKDMRIKVVHKECNEGLGYARNTGLEIATGEFIAFVDGDDYVDAKMYKELYNEAISSLSDVVYCGVFNEKRNGKWVLKSDLPQKTVFEGKHQIRNIMLDFIASSPYVKQERPLRMSVWHSIYKHSLIDDNLIRFKSERDIGSEDLPFQCEFLSKSSKIVFLPEGYYYYCLNDSSLTSTFKKEKFQASLRLRETMLTLFPNDKDVLLRIDRHIIGNFRRYVRLMLKTNTLNKNSILKEMLNNPIWGVLKKEFKPSFLQPYQSLIYKLQLYNCRFLLLFVIWVSLKIDRIK